MKTGFWFRAVVAAGVLTLAGCAPTTKTAPAKAAKGTAHAKSKDAAPNSDELTEARIEALTRFASGVSLDQRGKPREAIEEFRKAALADPGNEPLVTEIARRLLRARQTDKAVEVLEAATKQSKPAPSIFVLLGVAYGQLGKTDLAVATIRKALTRDPKNFLAYQNLFSVYLQAAKFKEARGVIAEAEKNGDSDADYLLDLTSLYARYVQLRPKELDELKPRVLALLERAQKLVDKADTTQLLRVADGFRAFGDLKRGTAIYTQLLKAAPDLPGLREKLVETYLRSDEPEKAKEQLTAILRDNPTNPQLYYLLGTIAAEAKDGDKRDEKLEEAAGHFEKVLLLNPKFEPAYFDLVQVRLRLKQVEAALKVLDRARGLFGSTYLVEFFTGMAHNEAKDYPAALKALTSAELLAKTSETNRLTAGFYFQLGAVNERLKDFPMAEKHFRKAIELQADFAEALNYLGYMWAERGTNLQEAFTMIDKAVKLEPENGAYLDSMAWVLFQQGKAKEAVPWIEKALKFTKEPDPTLQDHLGDIYLKAGKRDRARDAWKKSLELEKSPAVQKKLDAIERRGS
ncbi:MAG TPA: tetratricopeptide repeat protein [Verrucomicrobiae bacterium]|jgi:tetratricopeptide (TPR) repeat protein